MGDEKTEEAESKNVENPSLPRVLEYSSLKDLFQNPIFRWRFFATHTKTTRFINENIFISSLILLGFFTFFYLYAGRWITFTRSSDLIIIGYFFSCYYYYYLAAWWFILRDKSRGILHDLSYTSVTMKQLAFGYVYDLFISRSIYVIYMCLLTSLFPPIAFPSIRYIMLFLLIIQTWKILRKPRLGIITCNLLFSTTSFTDFFKISLFLFSPIVAQVIFTGIIFWLIARLNYAQVALTTMGIIAVSIILITGIILIQYLYYRFNTRTYKRLASEFDNFDEMLMYQIWETK